MSDKQSCECDSCQKACQYNPGWFLPGEAEKLAAHLGISLQECFERYLGVNWWEGDSPVFVLAPAVTKMTPGNEYPGDPRGTCVFYKDGKCDIHAVKPFECRELWHDEREEVDTRHSQVADAWDTPDSQQQIVRLLGREPETEDFGLMDALFSGFGL